MSGPIRIPCPIETQSPLYASTCAELQIRKEALEIVPCRGEECCHYRAMDTLDVDEITRELERYELARRNMKAVPRDWNQSKLPPRPVQPTPADLPSASEPPVDLAPEAPPLSMGQMNRIEAYLAALVELNGQVVAELRRLNWRK